MDSSLVGRTILMTGGTAGVGLATAYELARVGGHVVLAGPSRESAPAVVQGLRRGTGNRMVEHVHLDLRDLSSVRDAAATLVERGDRIDAVVAHAAPVGVPGTTAQGFELTFGVDHLGHVLLITSLLDQLRHSSARIVIAASAAHHWARRLDVDALRERTHTSSGLREFAVSQLCNVLFAQELGRRVDADRVTVCAVHPHWIPAGIWARTPWPFRRSLTESASLPLQGAATALRCVTADRLGGPNGAYWSASQQAAVNPIATDALAAELWRLEEEWTAPFRATRTGSPRATSSSVRPTSTEA